MAGVIIMLHIFTLTFFFTAVGSAGDSSSVGDYSLLRLSVEAPILLKFTYKPCVQECIKKNQREPNELSMEGGILELGGKLAIGFGEVEYDLTALSAKVYGLGFKKRFV